MERDYTLTSLSQCLESNNSKRCCALAYPVPEAAKNQNTAATPVD
jgi:hypothetical protein